MSLRPCNLDPVRPGCRTDDAGDGDRLKSTHYRRSTRCRSDGHFEVTTRYSLDDIRWWVFGLAHIGLSCYPSAHLQIDIDFIVQQARAGVPVLPCSVQNVSHSLRTAAGFSPSAAGLAGEWRIPGAARLAAIAGAFAFGFTWGRRRAALHREGGRSRQPFSVHRPDLQATAPLPLLLPPAPRSAV
ncbi:hypothetical protein OKW42_000878 [Paraburkholderia sp. WC7.3d]